MKKNRIKKKQILQLLKEIHLDGVFNECLIIIKKGTFHVSALDITNSMIITTHQKIIKSALNDELGIGNIDLLIKFLSSLPEEKITFSKIDNYLLFSIKNSNSRKKLEYLLTQPDLISTRLLTDNKSKKRNRKADDEVKKILKQNQFHSELSEQFLKDHSTYMAMMKAQNKSDIVTISFNEAGKITFIYGEKNSHRLMLNLESDITEGEDFSLNVNGDHLSKIFNIIEYSTEAPPFIHFDEDKPIVIQHRSTAWALVPIVDEEGDE